MAGRRQLVEGLKPPAGADPALEKQFVYGGKADAETAANPPPPPAPAGVRDGKGPPPAGRLPLTTRVRADYAAALKRASLERQLAGEEPNTLQDILEEALGPWLRDRGYVK